MNYILPIQCGAVDMANYQINILELKEKNIIQKEDKKILKKY
jgi:hypothetical protein